ncbi:MAG: cyclic nucleotide-binding domain-containing protein [Spirochaetes bacterium]|nr:cyclic nucleotide-binding domain-containing protein [Spirochaetota bacterium]
MAETQKLIIRPKHYASGSVLFRQGDNSRDVYILHSGKIGVYVDEIEVAILTESGIFIGESAALLEEPRNATGVVLMDSTLTELPGKFLDKIIQQHAGIGFRLLQILAKRLQLTTKNFTGMQKNVIHLKKEINKLRRIPEKVGAYDMLTELLLEMGYVTEAEISKAKRRQEELLLMGVEKNISNILVEMNVITMYQMIEVMKVQREISGTRSDSPR